FKVPQLYNLKDVRFLGHGGNFSNVREVIEYKNKAISQNIKVPQKQISNLFVELKLTVKEINALTDFIENALHDPDLKRYQPTYVPSGFCFPNNDKLSKEQMNCNAKQKIFE
ncbi:MAG: cytochrome-c peroxidase, partial [Saprospiraceae bacterium]